MRIKRMRFSFILSILQNLVPRFIKMVLFKHTEMNAIHVFVPVSHFFSFMLFVKKHSLLKVDQLTDICPIDFVSSVRRFCLVYAFLSTTFRFRMFVYINLCENEFVPSLSQLYKNALWLEREVWDMMGIFFFNHPDLRRILTDYGFEGFPLRKTFPLSGYIELRYDDEKMHIVYEPLELSQNYRYFNSLSPWEGVRV